MAQCSGVLRYVLKLVGSFSESINMFDNNKLMVGNQDFVPQEPRDKWSSADDKKSFSTTVQ